MSTERTDTERLDWLEQNAPNDLLVQFHTATNVRSYTVAYKTNGLWYTNLRAAIDGAMYIQSQEQSKVPA